MKKNNWLKTILLLITGMILGVLLFIFIIAAAISGFTKTKQVMLKNNSYLIINYTGKISEKPVSTFSGLLTGSPNELELLDILDAIKNASYNPKIVGIIINADGINYQKAHIEEINKALLDFKKTGKKITAWFSVGGNNNYHLCLNADQIYMPDTVSAELTLTGYSMNIPYIKKGLDKIGVEFNIIHMGKYKGTGENYVNENMSIETKESYFSLLNSLYDQKLNEISDARKINLNKLNNLLSSGKSIFLTPDEAKSNGLIDDKKSYRELTESLKKDSTYNFIILTDFITNIKTVKKNSLNKIAVLYIEGMITNGYSSIGVSGNISGAKSIINDIKNIKNNNNIKALLLRVNSPGGSALGSELILEALNDLKKTKPVFVSMGPIAASGGYYISLAGEKIFSLPSTITGSIGVVSMFVNVSKLNEKLGINYQTVKKHKFDDFLSPTRKIDSEEILIMKKMMKNIYNEFTGHVIKSRKFSKTDLSKIAEGRVWSGNQSVKNKLTDEIKPLNEIIEEMAKIYKIENYSVESYPKAAGLFEFIEDYAGANTFINTFLIKEYSNYLSFYEFYKETHYFPVVTYLPFYENF